MPYVGVTTLAALLDHATAGGVPATCTPLPTCTGPALSCGAEGLVRVANTTPFWTLDAMFDHRVASGILKARPIISIVQLDSIPYVGPATLEALFDLGAAWDYYDSCTGSLDFDEIVAETGCVP